MPSPKGELYIKVALSQTWSLYQGLTVVNHYDCFLFKVAAGKVHFGVVTMENELYTWATAQGGAEMVGQLGHGNTAMYKAPKRVESFEGVHIKQVDSICQKQMFCLSEKEIYAFQYIQSNISSMA